MAKWPINRNRRKRIPDVRIHVQIGSLLIDTNYRGGSSDFSVCRVGKLATD